LSGGLPGWGGRTYIKTRNMKRSYAEQSDPQRLLAPLLSSVLADVPRTAAFVLCGPNTKQQIVECMPLEVGMSWRS
jgi:hypothetical protein